jgi:hypothetical protein
MLLHFSPLLLQNAMLLSATAKQTRGMCYDDDEKMQPPQQELLKNMLLPTCSFFSRERRQIKASEISNRFQERLQIKSSESSDLQWTQTEAISDIKAKRNEEVNAHQFRPQSEASWWMVEPFFKFLQKD